MALPLWMLKDLHIQSKQKYGLAALFSMAIIGVILDVVRTVYTVQSISGEVANFAYTGAIYNNIELELLVIVSTLVAYRALFGTQRKRDTLYRNLPRCRPSPWCPRMNILLGTGENHVVHTAAISDDLPKEHQSSSLNRSSEPNVAVVQDVV